MAYEIRGEGVSETWRTTLCPCHQRADLLLLTFEPQMIGQSPRSVTFGFFERALSIFTLLSHLPRSLNADPFTNLLPRTALDPPSPVTRVIRLALQVLLRSPTPAGASLPTSLSLIGSSWCFHLNISLSIGATRLPRSAQEPETSSRRLHAGRRLSSKQAISQTYPRLTKCARSHAIYALLHTSSAVRLRSSPCILPTVFQSGLFLNAHHHRSLRQQLEVV